MYPQDSSFSIILLFLASGIGRNRFVVFDLFLMRDYEKKGVMRLLLHNTVKYRRFFFVAVITRQLLSCDFWVWSAMLISKQNIFCQKLLKRSFQHLQELSKRGKWRLWGGCAVPWFSGGKRLFNRFIHTIAPARVLVPPPKTHCRKS